MILSVERGRLVRSAELSIAVRVVCRDKSIAAKGVVRLVEVLTQTDPPLTAHPAAHIFRFVSPLKFFSLEFQSGFARAKSGYQQLCIARTA